MSGDWIATQRKTFTRWANQYLKRNGLSMTDISTELEDGLKLAALLEILSDGDKVGKLNKNARMDIQKLENLNQCLNFIKAHDVQLVNIGSRDIMEASQGKKDDKLILGLMWSIILFFEASNLTNITLVSLF